jgi:hypothetical protein
MQPPIPTVYRTVWNVLSSIRAQGGSMYYIVFRNGQGGLYYETYSKHLGDLDRIAWEHKLSPGDVIYMNEYFRVLTEYDNTQIETAQFQYLSELSDQQFKFGGRAWTDEMGEDLLREAEKHGARSR